MDRRLVGHAGNAHLKEDDPGEHGRHHEQAGGHHLGATRADDAPEKTGDHGAGEW